MTQFICALEDISSNYRVALCDIWGVLHSGGAVYPSALETIRIFREGGGVVLLLSNAPYLGQEAVSLLAAKGLARSAYDHVLTAGDITLSALKQASFGIKCFVVGSPNGHKLLDEAGIQAVAFEDAQFALVAGADQPESHLPLLMRMAEKKMPLVCANPDHVVKIGNIFHACAGALAKLYEECGGLVHYFGKPHKDIYARAFEILGLDRTGNVSFGTDFEPKIESSRTGGAEGSRLQAKRYPEGSVSGIIAIGDGLITDVTGAQREELDCLFVAAGIHADDCLDADGLLDKLKTAACLGDLSPRYVIDRLR